MATVRKFAAAACGGGDLDAFRVSVGPARGGRVQVAVVGVTPAGDEVRHVVTRAAGRADA